MSSTESEIQRTSQSWSLLKVRVIALSVLFILEIGFLSIRHDTGVLAGDYWWQRLSQEVPLLTQLAAVIMTATLIFGGSRVTSFLDDEPSFLEENRNWPWAVGVHLILFGCFSYVTWYFIEKLRGDSIAWFTIWAIAAIGWLSSAGAIAVPPKSWFRLVKPLGIPLATGCAIGLVALISSRGAASLWSELSFLTLIFVNACLSILGLSTIVDIDQSIIGTSLFSVQIAPECSGYEGMGLALAFIGIYLLWNRDLFHFPNALFVLPIGLLVVYLLNVVRITSLIALGHFGWPDFALGGFHSQAGWLAFNFAVLGTVLCSSKWNWILKSRSLSDQAVIRHSSLDAIPMLLPFTLLMLAVIGTNGSPSLYFIRVLAVVLPLIWMSQSYWPKVQSWSFQSSPVWLGLAVFAVWLVLEKAIQPVPSQSLVEALKASGSLSGIWLVWRCIGSCLTVPIAEELAFRGYLLPFLGGESTVANDSGLRSTVALLLSSLAFGFMHPGRWMAGTLAGIAFGFAYYRRRQLVDAVLSHSTCNILVAAYVLGTGDATMWN